MSESFIIRQTGSRSGHRYLERIPYDGSWSWLASSVEHATPMDLATAEALAMELKARGEHVEIRPDVLDLASEVTVGATHTNHTASAA